MTLGLVSFTITSILALTPLNSLATDWKVDSINLLLNGSDSPITKLLKPFYCEKSSIVDVICDDNIEQISDIVRSLLISFESCTSFQINSVHNASLVEKRRRVFNLLILENFASFSQLMLKVSRFEFNFNGFFSLIFIDIKLSEIVKVFDISWANFMHNLNVIAVDKFNRTTLFTYEPFRNGKCDDTSPILKHVSGSTTLIDIFPNKMSNLHKCPLQVPEINYFQATQFSVEANESTISGIEGDMLMATKDALNFTIKILLDTKNERWGKKSFIRLMNVA